VTDSARRAVGRFAPSPSGSLHLGNLRTALVAWCAARHAGGAFLVRMEDLTTGAVADRETEQLADLAALGLDHDGEVVRQSERRAHYDAAIDRLVDAGRTYDCFCSRREIREAAAAPHAPSPGAEASEDGTYPGTCRDLSNADRARRRAEGRAPALRLRADHTVVTAHDHRLGELELVVDDLVLRRADGVAAYHLAVVVDDALQGVTQVVRGDDLWTSTPRQVLLQQLLGLPTPEYLHVPLVLGPDGARLAKRHGSVTLADRFALGERAEDVLGLLATSLGWAGPGERLDAAQVLERFDPDSLPREPWTLVAPR
jgi:glutamyl-tRNA synthetase